MSDDAHDYVVKYIIIGDSCVGKTNLLYRFMEDKFIEDNMPTIGVDMCSKVVNIREYALKLQIWDTAGTERFRSITFLYYRDAGVVFMVFSLNNYESFKNLTYWYDDLRVNCRNSDVLIYLIGTFADKRHFVSDDDVEGFMKDRNIFKYFKISVKDDIVHKIFLESAKEVYEKIKESEKVPVGIRKNEDPMTQPVKCQVCTIM